MFNAPFFRQFSTNRSREHGLAEKLDNIWDTSQMGLGGLHLSQQSIELASNFFLFGQWGKWKVQLAKMGWF
ncbi:hypothetical protein KAM461_35360 [Aeromonas hydrophila]|nr:hypothetical protein KAM461_35360 [Aeromonas hydrophila]